MLRSDFDIRSLVLEQPFFNFKSREFFISHTSSCDQPLQHVSLQRVPTSLEIKKRQWEQRFKVKMLQEAVQGVLNKDASPIHKMKDAWSYVEDAQHTPAVELHMFPNNASDPLSRWTALLIPTVKEAFGQAWFLCQPADGKQQRCVAELPFPPLPFRLLNVIGKWDPVLDRHKSTPHLRLLMLEAFVVASVAMILGTIVYAVCKSWQNWQASERVDEGYAQMLHEFPVSYRLTRHAYVYKDINVAAGLAKGTALDAGVQVELRSTKLGPSENGSIWSWLGLKENRAVWGYMEEAGGWIVMYDEATECPRVIKKDVAVVPSWRAHFQLLPPLRSLLLQNALLLGAYLSSLWMALTRLPRLYSDMSFLLLLLGTLVMHLLVLNQQARTAATALAYDEVLEIRSELLRLEGASRGQQVLFCTILGMIASLLCFQTTGVRADAQAVFCSFCITMALRGKSMHDSMKGLKMWREPRLENAEFLGVQFQNIPCTSEGVALSDLSVHRAQQLLIRRSIAWLSAGLALMAVAWTLLDMLQMRGELLHYGLNRGHMVHPPHLQAFHNTLLLDTVDAMTLSYEPNAHTHEMSLTIEHPQLDNATVSLPCNGSGVYQLSLPPGPLYSRISVNALGLYASNTYTIHIIRVGAAINVSLQGTVAKDPLSKLDTNDTGLVFFEERRLEYHRQNPVWYIPNLALSSNITTRVHLQPVPFGPLLETTSHSPQLVGDVPRIAEHCSCGSEKAGFGNQCAGREDLVSPRALCIFVFSAVSDIHLDSSKAGVAGMDSEFMKFFQDTQVSGKKVALLLRNGGENQGSQVDTFPFAPSSTGEESLSMTFTIVKPLAALVQEGSQLMISQTTDFVDSEVSSLPLIIERHAPPLTLKTTCAEPERCFLLPEFEASEVRTEYAICGGAASVNDVQVKVQDARFKVDKTAPAPSKPECGELVDRRMEFRSIKTDQPWCSYLTRAETFDLVVVNSARLCLLTAVNLGDVSGFNRSMTQMTLQGCLAMTHGTICGSNFSHMVCWFKLILPFVVLGSQVVSEINAHEALAATAWDCPCM